MPIFSLKLALRQHILVIPVYFAAVQLVTRCRLLIKACTMSAYNGSGSKHNVSLSFTVDICTIWKLVAECILEVYYDFRNIFNKTIIIIIYCSTKQQKLLTNVK